MIICVILCYFLPRTHCIRKVPLKLAETAANPPWKLKRIKMIRDLITVNNKEYNSHNKTLSANTLLYVCSRDTNRPVVLLTQNNPYYSVLWLPHLQSESARQRPHEYQFFARNNLTSSRTAFNNKMRKPPAINTHYDLEQMFKYLPGAYLHPCSNFGDKLHGTVHAIR